MFVPDDSKHLIIDTGASTSVTGDKSDFMPDTVKALKKPFPLDGIAGSLTATHVGTCHFEALTDDASIVVLETEALYAPGMNCTLFSPQAYFVEQHAKGISNFSMQVTWCNTVLNLGHKKIPIPYDPTVRLPILRCYKNAMDVAESMATVCITDEANQNLTNNQKNMLQWHWKLGHVGFQQLQWIGRQGWLGSHGQNFGKTTVAPPKCDSCKFGNQECTP